MSFPGSLFLAASAACVGVVVDALQAHRIAVGVAQVGVFERALVARRSPASRCATKRAVRASTSSSLPRPSSIVGAAVELGLPGAARRQRERRRCARRAARAPADSRPIHREHRAPSCRPGRCERRQVVVLDVAEVGLEDLAEAVDELARPRPRRSTARPAGAPRAAPQPVRPDAAHHRVAHPGHRLERAPAGREVEREEVAGELRHRVGADRRDAVARRRRLRRGSSGSRTAAGARARTRAAPRARSRRATPNTRRGHVHQRARRPAASARHASSAQASGHRVQASGRRRVDAPAVERAPRAVHAERLVARCRPRAPTSAPANAPVMPGEVFISSRNGLRSLRRTIRSARPQPRQPSVR